MLNSKICSVYNEVKIGDTISFVLNFEEDNSNIVPVKMNLDIIYEDESYIIINKPNRNSCSSIHVTL